MSRALRKKRVVIGAGLEEVRFTGMFETKKERAKAEAAKATPQRDIALERRYGKYLYGSASKIEGTTGNDCWSFWDCPNWMGARCIQMPWDMIAVGELIYERRPDLIVECGTANGGMTLFMQNHCDLLHHGRVVSVDIQDNIRPPHPNILYRQCGSLDPKHLSDLAEVHASGGLIMVVLDSDHSKDHVLAELNAYGPLVTKGQYLLVHDMNMHFHFPEYGPGPWEAVEEWVPSEHGFAVDQRREKYGMSYYEGGFLLKVKP